MRGKKTGGRQKGAANKRTREIADKAVAEGLTPLEYLLSVVRDVGEDRATRIDAAKAAAPFIHPRLANETFRHTGSIEITKIRREIVRA